MPLPYGNVLSKLPDKLKSVIPGFHCAELGESSCIYGSYLI